MFRSGQPGENAYAKTKLETGVLSASPHKLTTMLFDAALLALRMAQRHMKAGNTEHMTISRSIMLIENGLRASLNREAGGEIADNLDAMFDYMGRRQLAANLKNQPELLDQVHDLLKQLTQAWAGIAPGAQAQSFHV
jgi:flagellar protein FliS